MHRVNYLSRHDVYPKISHPELSSSQIHVQMLGKLLNFEINLFFQALESGREFMQPIHACVRCVTAGVMALGPLHSALIDVSNLKDLIEHLSVLMDDRGLGKLERALVKATGKDQLDGHAGQDNQALESRQAKAFLPCLKL